MELDTRKELRRDVTSLHKNYELFKDYNLSPKVALRYLNYLENLNRLLYEVSISLDPLDKKTADYSRKCLEMIDFFRSKCGNLETEANDSVTSMNSTGNTSTLSANEIELRNEIDELNQKLEERNNELIRLRELNDQLLNSHEDSRADNIRTHRELYLEDVRRERDDRKNVYLNIINKENQKTNQINNRKKEHTNQNDIENQEQTNEIGEEKVYNRNVSKLLNYFQKNRDEQLNKNEKVIKNSSKLNSTGQQNTTSKSNSNDKLNETNKAINKLKITESFRSKELNLIKRTIKSEEDKTRSKTNIQKVKIEKADESKIDQIKIEEDTENSINVQQLIEFYEELRNK